MTTATCSWYRTAYSWGSRKANMGSGWRLHTNMGTSHRGERNPHHPPSSHVLQSKLQNQLCDCVWPPCRYLWCDDYHTSHYQARHRPREPGTEFRVGASRRDARQRLVFGICFRHSRYTWLDPCLGNIRPCSNIPARRHHHVGEILEGGDKIEFCFFNDLYLGTWRDRVRTQNIKALYFFWSLLWTRNFSYENTRTV